MKGSRFLLVVCLVTLGFQSAVCRGAEDEHIKLPSGWPTGWADAYQQFERFIAARQQYWPRSNLEITNEGHVIDDLSGGDKKIKSFGLEIYKNGAVILDMLYNGKTSLLDQSRPNLLGPGTFAVCIKSCGLTGYQYEFPIAWFSISTDPKFRGQRSAGIAPSDPPVDPNQFWPNERGLLFLDFHILPNHNPGNIEKMNRRVNPTIQLRVDKHGVIWREPHTDSSAERFLRWRIYHNGLLMESGQATGATKYVSDRGIGNYVAWLGIEGPNGFMPVSNMLVFPLFPETTGEHVISPSLKGNAPQCVIEARDRLQAAEDTENDERLTKVEQINDQLLIDLWKEWAWHLKNSPPLATDVP